MKNTQNRKAYPRVPSILSWLFPYKRKGLSVSTDSPLSYYLYQNKLSLIVINWVFQGMRSMGRADLIGKILLDIFLFAIFAFICDASLTFCIAISLVAAHTLNWLFNTHFWDLGRFIGITRTDPGRFFPYLRAVQSRVARDDSISSVIVIGGVSRNLGFRETSDVDIIFLRKNGYRDSVCSVSVAVRERMMAFFMKFPLHLELYDSVHNVQHRPDEVPILIKDDGDTVKTYYVKDGKNTALLDDYDPQD